MSDSVNENFQSGLDSLLTDKAKQKILQERQTQLAQNLLGDDIRVEGVQKESLQLLEFLIGRERFSFEAHYVHEVCRLRDVTPIPGTPAHIVGVINYRGVILTVIDLSPLLELKNTAISSFNKAVVLTVNGIKLGIMADEILDVSWVPLSKIKASPVGLNEFQAHCTQGVTEDRLIVLDAKRLVGDHIKVG